MSIQEHVDSVRANLSLQESEETWDTILRAISSLSSACADADSYTPSDIVAAIRPIHRPIISAMNSERGRLSGVAIDLVATLASSLGPAFDPLLHHLFPVLLTLSSRTSKVTVVRARACILTVIDATQLPSIISYLLQSATDKSVSLRLTVVESTLACLNCFNPPDLEKDSKAKEIEAIIRVASRDANADVRKVCRKMFDAYKVLLPGRVDRFIAPLSPTTRKYLDIKVAPKALAVPSKQPQLSSSTSAMKPSTSDRAKTHMRSASSPAVAREVAVQPERPKRIELVLHPKSGDPIPPSRTILPSSTSERKRVVSMSATARPGSRHRDDGDAKQPVPTTSQQPIRRAPQEKEAAAPAPVLGARRILITESKAVQRVANTASTPAIRAMPSTVPAPKPVAAKTATTRPAMATGSSSAAGKRFALPQTKPSPQKTVSKHKAPVKTTLLKPTLSQLARVKTIERRVVAASNADKRAPRKAPLPPRKTKKPAEDKLWPVTTTNAEGNLDEKIEAEPTLDDKNDEKPAETPELSHDDSDADVEHKRSPSPVPTPMVSVDSLDLATPPRTDKALDVSANKTPISQLLLSIERGFLFTPSAPMSPPDSYLSLRPPGMAIPFPMQTTWPHAQQQTSPTSLKPLDAQAVWQLEARRAFGNIETNK
ncbi:clasp N terminal-domain-containing protein, partial [Mycena amicta]